LRVYWDTTGTRYEVSRNPRIDIMMEMAILKSKLWFRIDVNKIAEGINGKNTRAESEIFILTSDRKDYPSQCNLIVLRWINVS